MQELSPPVKNDPRKNDRVLVRSLFPTETQVSFRQEGSRALLKGVLFSISSAGLFIKTDRIPPVDSPIAVMFIFGGRHVHCQGRVIYHHPKTDELLVPGFGVKYTRMLSQDLRIIQEVIKDFNSTMAPFTTGS